MKILLGILVLSFGVFWGVAEFFRSPSAANNVATIGRLSVSKQDLVRSVQQEMNRINAQLKGQNITFAQALKFGLVSQTLVRIVNEILIEMFMKDTKLTVSEQAIANLILQTLYLKTVLDNLIKCNSSVYWQPTN
ncbi:MAG: SurA N-terminal domain-containing protein [Holosporaceae bacterium]|nr:MAG: SurA N-terminal domain-containing protein [Holosporaceae bacterium]